MRYQLHVDEQVALRTRELRDAAEAEGRAEGLAEGLAEGRAEGRAEGLREGRQHERDLILSLARKLSDLGRIDELAGVLEDDEALGSLMRELGIA